MKTVIKVSLMLAAFQFTLMSVWVSAEGAGRNAGTAAGADCKLLTH